MMTRSQGKLQAREPTANPRRRQIKLKQQILTRSPRDQARKKRKFQRSVSSSCSFSPPSQSRMDAKSCSENMSGGTVSGGTQSGKAKSHRWDNAEESLLARHVMEPQMLQYYQSDNKHTFYCELAKKINETYIRDRDYVELDDIKVKRKFQRCISKWNIYYTAPHPRDEKPPMSKEHLQLFIEANSRSSRPNSVSRGSRRKEEIEHVVPFDQDTSMQYLNKMGVDNKLLLQYMRLLKNRDYVYMFTTVKQDFDERIAFLNEMLEKEREMAA